MTEIILLTIGKFKRGILLRVVSEAQEILGP